ncbi:MAG: clostripain-related cysteine peptidase [Planctomycetota bacterium]|nr:clostripain-related cysteine peptidase [Planctomycetota bacterium]
MKKIYLCFIFLFFVVVSPSFAQQKQYDWTVIYVMSYDNNLNFAADPINKGLKKGLINDNVAVTVLMDRTDRNGLKRIVMTDKDQKESTLKTDDITKPKVLSDYLSWVHKTLPAKKYALVFLNHGGRLDQMCHDQYPDKRSRRGEWMSAHKTGPVIRQWKKKLGQSQLSFLFLQQCGRGSLENIYNFRETADYVMASQLVVGAPNTYYEKTLKTLCKEPKLGGKELGLAIMNNDLHYTTYVLLNGREIKNAKPQLNALVKDVLDQAKSLLKRPLPLSHCFDIGDEFNDDLKQFVQALYSINKLKSKTQLKSFVNWYEKTLIVEHRFSRPRYQQRLSWTGLSTYRGSSKKLFQRYSFLAIYTDTLWGRLQQTLNGASITKAKKKKRFF